MSTQALSSSTCFCALKFTCSTGHWTILLTWSSNAVMGFSKHLLSEWASLDVQNRCLGVQINLPVEKGWQSVNGGTFRQAMRRTQCILEHGQTIHQSFNKVQGASDKYDVHKAATCSTGNKLHCLPNKNVNIPFAATTQYIQLEILQENSKAIQSKYSIIVDFNYFLLIPWWQGGKMSSMNSSIFQIRLMHSFTL